MTIQASSFLRKLRKAQKSEGLEVFIDFEKMIAVTCHCANEPYKTINLANFRTSAHSILDYLKDLGYIEYNGLGYVKVHHTGWHTRQVAFGKFLSFLFRSILVPIGVSVATTLLTLMIQRMLNNPA